MTRWALGPRLGGMAEGFSSHDVPADERAVLRTFDELAGFLRASTDVPEEPEPDDAHQDETTGEVKK